MSEDHIRVDAGDGVRLLLDRYASGEVAGADADHIRRHLRSCQPCSRLFDETMRVRTHVRRAVAREEAPERLRLAIYEMIRG